MKKSSLILALTLFACGKQTSKDTGLVKVSERTPVSAEQMMKLTSFDSCAVADAYIQDNIRRIVEDRLEEQKMYYLQASDGRWESPVADSASESEESGKASNSSDAPQEYTKTNTQVAGVDEPDMMKTDGKFIYTLSGRHVQIVKSWPANDLKKISEIAVQGSPVALFLTEDNKLVVAYHPQGQIREEYKSYYSPWYYDFYATDYMVTTLAVYDVQNPAAPALVKTHNFRGNYHDMRRQGNNIRLITTNYWGQLPEGITTWVDMYNRKGEKISERDFLKALNDVRASNEAVLRKLDFKAWVKSQFQGWSANWQGVSDDIVDKDNYDCHSVYGSEVLGSMGLTTITSINLASGSVDQAALLANTTKIYNSEESLYLAYEYSYWWWGWSWINSMAPKTFIHKFQFESADSSKLVYKASGAIGGYMNDQFSMDEYEGNLRLAVTDQFVYPGDPVRGPLGDEAPRQATTVSRVVVLAEEDKVLSVIGQTPDLAAGERIYSARFDGKKGYVVTFRQTDPLFTLDLSDPKNPKVLGELKVNGFSTYIHLMDENHLLTVGQDADPNTGRALGLKITVFDVTDPAKPTELYTKLVAQGNGYAWSEASYDHHAFTYFASRGLLALPISGYRSSWSGDWWNAYFSDLRVYKIDLKNGISEQGGIAMNDLYRSQRVEWNYWWGGATVQRSIFADDYVYAISSAGIKVVRSDKMNEVVGGVVFYP